MTARDEAPAATGASDSDDRGVDSNGIAASDSNQGAPLGTAALAPARFHSRRRGLRHEFVDHEAGGWTHSARVDYCRNLHPTGVTGDGVPYVGDKGRPCRSLECEVDCAPVLLDRVVDHYVPLFLREPEMYVSMTKVTDDDRVDVISDRVTQRARRAALQGDPVQYVKVESDEMVFVFSTRPLGGRKAPTSWSVVSPEIAAILLDGLAVPNRVRRWPRGSQEWHITKQDQKHRASGGVTYGHFNHKYATYRWEFVHDRFEAETGYRSQLGVPVRPEDRQRLMEIAAEEFRTPDDIGLGDD